MNDKFIELFDHYIHSDEPRRVFLEKLVKSAGSVAAAAAVLPWLEGTGAEAAMVSPGDRRLDTRMESFLVDGQQMNAYVVRRRGKKKKLPTIVVIHENRGLTAHIQDVARRVAMEGFLAVAPDMISPVGSTPSNRDKARDMLYDIKKSVILKNLVATADFASKHSSSNGKVGCVGFCWGGARSNLLAVNFPKLKAAVAYYGSQPKKGIENINAALLLHYAGNDRRVNRGIKPYEKALKAAGKKFVIHKYAGTRHAFNNDGRPGRYKKKAATLAWKRTIAHFKKYVR
jgi:carboxymethylenebutenolidase